MTRCLLVLGLALAPGIAYAQDTTQKWPGLSTSELSTVYILDDTGAETSGKLVRLNPDSIVILAGGAERRFDAARIRRVQKRGDSIRNGVIIGAVVGAVFGAIGAGIADCPGVDRAAARGRARGCSCSRPASTQHSALVSTRSLSAAPRCIRPPRDRPVDRRADPRDRRRWRSASGFSFRTDDSINVLCLRESPRAGAARLQIHTDEQANP